MQKKQSRKETLTELAIDVMQAQGTSGMGLRGLAEIANIKAASLYNHFSSKDDLVYHAMNLYAVQREAELKVFEHQTTGGARIYSYLSLFEQCLRYDGRLCLCLMLMVERSSLSEKVMDPVGLFVDQHTAWLAVAWNQGRSDHSIKSEIAGEVVSPVIFGALEGITAFALLQPDPEAVFRAQAIVLLSALGVQTDAVDK
ncbi:hypothetical protein AEQ67_18905 [Pseudomonas sp. RIT-PI-q]|uniref:TetR/AcrR family transcriptional regulator n=1 Tax=Pseudomonas sp. RIT-PI-q TaxID=1690247 RepID=UPI0006CCBB3D|nr:TetR/AcrR family transcriptional regulator [Pseudomonas sp. RIT-PI-q]KPG96001.1 hypothetical protein AEQ67_18905 [Pseudomonas sp. RIT-PI-q]